VTKLKTKMNIYFKYKKLDRKSPLSIRIASFSLALVDRAAPCIRRAI
jgi:hypothetical protein